MPNKPVNTRSGNRDRLVEQIDAIKHDLRIWNEAFAIESLEPADPETLREINSKLDFLKSFLSKTINDATAAGYNTTDIKEKMMEEGYDLKYLGIR